MAGAEISADGHVTTNKLAPIVVPKPIFYSNIEVKNP